MDQRLNLKKIAHFILPVIYVITLLFLLYSIFVSGFHYTFDSDEFAHAQQTYLIATGNKPYSDFFSIYSPILHWLLLPIFTFFGFTFESIIFARLMMIVTFGIRIIISIYLMRLLFGKRTALIFLPLFLFDPFTIFVSMQIRPDNLMMTFFITALLLLYLGLSKKSGKITALSGALISLAFLTSIKILPSVVIIILILLIYGIYYHRSKIIKQFLLGFFLTMVIFLGYFLFQHSLPQMVQNIFFDPRANSNAISNPVPLGFFHWPNNAFIFGIGGKPATWIYEWILPFLALIGVYIVFSQVQTKSSKEYLPESILNRFPSVDHELEIKKVPYLLLDSNRMRNLKPQVEICIEEHYQKVVGDDELWIRK